jgi:hypothetical protein
VKEDRREWHQMSLEGFHARGTHLRESAQREAVRELARVNLIEKCEGSVDQGRQGANWIRLKPEVEPPKGLLQTKKGDPRPVRTPAAKKAALSHEEPRETNYSQRILPQNG